MSALRFWEVMIGAAALTIVGVAVATRQAQNIGQPANVAPATDTLMLSAEPVPPPKPTANRRAVLDSDASGHFWAEALVNGRSMRVMIDTGASVFAIPISEAQRLGIDPERDGRPVHLMTAAGPAVAREVELRRVVIGAVRVENVRAVIGPAGLETPLLGMSFLTRLRSMETRGQTLILTQ